MENQKQKDYNNIVDYIVAIILTIITLIITAVLNIAFGWLIGERTNMLNITFSLSCAALWITFLCFINKRK